MINKELVAQNKFEIGMRMVCQGKKLIMQAAQLTESEEKTDQMYMAFLRQEMDIQKLPN